MLYAFFRLSKKLDVPLNSEEKNKKMENQKAKREIDKIRAENCSDVLQEIKVLNNQFKQYISRKK